MAKKPAGKNGNGYNFYSTRWENTLPATYRAIIDGFHTDLTVGEMVEFLEINEMRAALKQEPVQIPEEIHHIKIGAFTPDMFAHEDFAEFWQTPVTSHHLYSKKAVFDALNDPDISMIQRENAGHNIDTVRPTLETLARVAQMQYLGFNLRMSELTSNSMMARLSQLRDPEQYAKLRELGKKYRIELPKDVPEFEIAQQETCVKQIGSALEKAYYRTGKPKDVEAFLQQPDHYGVNGVNDMKRTLIRIPENKENQFKNYITVRNLFAVASLSGELGFMCTEMTDHVLYPPSNRPSDLNPVLMLKGEMYHAGPVFGGKGSIVTSKVETQIAVMPEHATHTTHDLYKMSRAKDVTPEMRSAMDDARCKIFDSFLSDEVRERRQKYLETGRIENDAVGQILFAKSNGFDMTRHVGQVRHNAMMCAYREFPNEVGSLELVRDNIANITMKNSHQPVVRKALDLMIKRKEQIQVA